MQKDVGLCSQTNGEILISRVSGYSQRRPVSGDVLHMSAVTEEEGGMAGTADLEGEAVCAHMDKLRRYKHVRPVQFCKHGMVQSLHQA